MPGSAARAVGLVMSVSSRTNGFLFPFLTFLKFASFFFKAVFLILFIFTFIFVAEL